MMKSLVDVELLDKQELSWSFDWVCEKWSEEAVDYTRKKLDRMGITHVPAHVEEQLIVTNKSGLDRVISRLLNRPVSEAHLEIVPAIIPVMHGVPSAILREIVGAPEEVAEIPGNLLVNEGIQRLLDLLIAAGGTAYNNANAFIGVGDTATAAAATDVELTATQNAANRFYKAMNATFPSRASQTVTWQSDFTSAEANFHWQEWTIAAGATTASGSGFLVGTTNLNHKITDLGTKTTGTWTLSGQVTVS